MTHRCCAICEAFFYQCSIKFEIPPGVCGLIDFGLLKDWSRSIKPKASGMARNTKAIHSSEITNLMLFLSLRALLLLKCSNVFFAHPAVITQPPSEPFINYAQGGHHLYLRHLKLHPSWMIVDANYHHHHQPRFKWHKLILTTFGFSPLDDECISPRSPGVS
jgi:hypothetical protein